ncbi:putative Glycosyltransferase [Vibrio crassostreae]|nr:putative Glycosyltransferase [Vibrio crassostreae]CAK3448808.1 putative Glycosyltransferase [Vibrio crassostreae]
MKILVNFNEYLGGGETLVIRMFEEIPELPALVITSKDSYISKNIPPEYLCEYSGSSDFDYLNSEKKEKFYQWFDSVLPEKTHLQFVTFCMRDLHIINSFIRVRGISNYSITHLLLHPLDHLYLCQSLPDKILLSFFGIAKYSMKRNRESNALLLKSLNESNSLIPMNNNVLTRLYRDTGIVIEPKKIIPLPYLKDTDDCFEWNRPKLEDAKRIVWLGRIVDFKLPSILAMIDFVAKNKSYYFDIVGYGNEKVINRHISKFDSELASRVRLLGAIPHDSLSSTLSQYDIGYGMGTSIVELTRYGLPTIVALASPDYKLFRRTICGGLVYDQVEGNVGDDLYDNAEQDFASIEDTINRILYDEGSLEKSICYIRSVFSFTTNMKRYFQVINNVKELSLPHIDMKIGLLKRMVFLWKEKNEK